MSHSESYINFLSSVSGSPNIGLIVGLIVAGAVIAVVVVIFLARRAAKS